MSAPYLVGTLAAIALFALIFLRGRAVHPLGALGRRTVVSVAGGAAVAYVFMDLLPDVHAAAGAFREATAHLGPSVLGVGVNLAAMAGFLFFYGVEELVIRSEDDEDRRRRRSAGKSHPLFRIHVTAFAAYGWVVSYLLVRSPAQTAAALAGYAAAMAMHFIGVSHALREEHGDLYDRVGAPLLALGCAAGWACGVVVGLPSTVIGLLLGGVAGGVIANTVISELPREKEGKFLPFLTGAAAYAGLLVAAG